MGRAPHTKETLPNFRERCRVTGIHKSFRGLTGSQQTPGFWGVTDLASTHLILLYSLICATTLSDRASTHLILQYSHISATTLSISASGLLLCATTPQYCTVPSGTYCVVSYLFFITGLGSQTLI